MDMTEKEIFERLTALESSQKSLHKRIDHIEGLVESMQKMTVEMTHMRQELNKVVEAVENINNKPAKLWETMITAVLSACGGGIVTFIATKITGG